MILSKNRETHFKGLMTFQNAVKNIKIDLKYIYTKKILES